MSVQNIFLYFCTFQALCVICDGQQGQLQGIIKGDPRYYTNYEVLEPKRYILEWTVNWPLRRILFKVTVETTGYVMFGLSKRGALKRSDMVVCGVDTFGVSYINNFHETSIDQDWKGYSASENRSHTFLAFSKPFESFYKRDYQINDHSSITVIWGYGEVDALFPSLIENYGHKPFHLLDPTVVPRSLKEYSFLPGAPPPEVLLKENLEVWTISSSHRIAPFKTEYFCTMHRGPRLSRRNYILGFHMRLESSLARRHTHRVLLYHCVPPSYSTAKGFFESYMNRPGEQCRFLTRPEGSLPTQYCTELLLPFAMGGKSLTFFPEHEGVSISDEEYFLLQVLYRNPEERDDIEYDINIDMYHNDELRDEELGVLVIGHQIPGLLTSKLIPSQYPHNIYGHGGKECTSLMLPQEGINISTALLHAPSSVNVKLRHFRGKRELPWISADDNYQSDVQEYRLLRNEAQILPGDHLMTQCEYDKSWTNQGIIDGGSNGNEACVGYLFYYTQLDNFSFCRSAINI